MADISIASDGGVDPAVVIIGAGPGGLALAIELGSRGVSCLLVERNDRAGYAPRAETTNVRTRTHLRRWGVADKLAEVSPFGVHYPTNVHFVTSLGGKSPAVIENAFNCAAERTLGTVLGGGYDHSPIIEEDASPKPASDNATFSPSSRPGSLAPHLWRLNGSSLYDAFGPGFSLVCRPDADRIELEHALAEAAALHAPLTIVSLDRTEGCELYPLPLTLVRPDQYVAWRGARWRPDLLRKVSGWLHPPVDPVGPTSLHGDLMVEEMQ